MSGLKPRDAQNIVPWLMLNRDGLDVLVRRWSKAPMTTPARTRALWLGTPVPMKLDILRPTYGAQLLPKDARHPA
jgi:aromatic ring-cleaving dioxygenase